MIDRYHPWGPFEWLLPRLGSEPWSLLGGISPEDRSVAIVEGLAPPLRDGMTFIEVEDPDPPRPSALAAKMSSVRDSMIACGASETDFIKARLLQDVDTMYELFEVFLDDSRGRVILDISVLPKRWFFPALRYLMKDSRVRDLVVTYSSAEQYGDQLSSDPGQLAPLPTFDGDPTQTSYEEVVVGIGFAPLGLRDLYSADIEKIRYLFPFPPGPPYFNRNWKFLRELETEIENRNLQADDHWHVHMYDCPSTFGALCKFTADGRRVTALAPFGPKTLSLAMCLFALALEASNLTPAHVLYTQPRRYSLDYSSGVSRTFGVPDIMAYLVKSDGKALYVL